MLPPPVQLFRAPQYNGQADIEYFISRFEEIFEANEWGPVATLLHLRDSFKKSAENCGRVANVQAVYVALRPGFDCRSKKRGPVLAFYKRTSVHLSKNMPLRLRSWSPTEHRAGIRLETFCNTLGYVPLQRHLLGVPTHTEGG